MRVLCAKPNVVVTAGPVLVFVLVFANGAAFADKVVVDPAMILERLGHPTDTIDQILVATKSENYVVRHLALEVLTERIGKEAISTLKVSLGDPHVRVRCRSAHLLGKLRDKSGLSQMQKDLKELAPYNGAPLPLDPNAIPEPRKKRKGGRNYYVGEALIVARVLAELGDRSGYELAARMARQGPLAVLQKDAALALAEMAKTDQQTLAAEGVDPVSLLCEMAASERRETVFGALVSSVQNLPADTAVRILKTAQSSADQSALNRRVAEMAINRIHETLPPSR